MLVQVFGGRTSNEGVEARNVVANSSQRQLQAVHSGRILQADGIEVGLSSLPQQPLLAPCMNTPGLCMS